MLTYHEFFQALQLLLEIIAQCIEFVTVDFPLDIMIDLFKILPLCVVLFTSTRKMRRDRDEARLT